MKLLLAFDPSEPHEDLLQAVLARNWPVGSDFSVLAVVEPVYAEVVPQTVPDLVEKITRNAIRKSEVVANVLRSEGFDANPVVLEGDPRSVIPDEAINLGVNRILLGPPHQDGMLRFLNGRVTRSVLRHALCSVEILRTGEIHRVLVPTDGSEAALAAARAIAARSWDEDTEFEVISVVQPLHASLKFLYPAHVDSEEARDLRAQAMKKAQSAIAETEQILVAAGLKVSDKTLFPTDMPAKVIIDEASASDFDLIVMGSHGASTLKRILIGSVSESTALHAPCSVEVIR
jgi:nucleotide-binding universal stress UspA family protein